jgi:hypothetical protein
MANILTGSKRLTPSPWQAFSAPLLGICTCDYRQINQRRFPLYLDRDSLVIPDGNVGLIGTSVAGWALPDKPDTDLTIRTLDLSQTTRQTRSCPAHTNLSAPFWLKCEAQVMLASISFGGNGSLKPEYQERGTSLRKPLEFETSPLARISHRGTGWRFSAPAYTAFVRPCTSSRRALDSQGISP